MKRPKTCRTFTIGRDAFIVLLGVMMYICSEVLGASSDGILQVHVLSRHCDRLPITALKIPNDPVDWVKISGDSQLGDLTGLGQHQCNYMGDVLYNRYLDHNAKHKIMGITPKYSSTNYYFRSTALDRTLMSMWSISMGLFKQGSGQRPVYNYENQHDEGRSEYSLPNGTQAVPIHTVEEEMDSLLLGFSFCNTVLQRMQNVKKSREYIQFFETNKQFIADIYNATGWKESDSIAILFDLMTVQRAHGLLKLDWVNNNWEKIDKLRNDYLLMTYSYNVIGKEGSSVLISSILDLMASVNKKYLHYSAHDTTLQSFTASLKLNKDYPQLGYQPKYGANIAVELHQMNDGTRAVRLVHNSQYNDTQFTPLIMKSLGCTNEFCPFDTFKQLATQYSTVEDWCSSCDNKGRAVCSSEYLKTSDTLSVAFLVSTPTLAFTNAVTLILVFVCCARAQMLKSRYVSLE